MPARTRWRRTWARWIQWLAIWGIWPWTWARNWRIKIGKSTGSTGRYVNNHSSASYYYPYQMCFNCELIAIRLILFFFLYPFCFRGGGGGFRMVFIRRVFISTGWIEWDEDSGRKSTSTSTTQINLLHFVSCNCLWSPLDVQLHNVVCTA